jgi:phosphoribosylanthranilate isomerase
MTKVKICGLRRLDDALLAAKLGADFCGLVFVPGRDRRVEVSDAARLVAGFRKAWRNPAPTLVGLFADQPAEDVRSIVKTVGLDAAQLCGNESWDYAKGIGVRVLKVHHVDGRADAQARSAARMHLEACRAHGAIAILDAYVRGLQGGTGRTFDWSVVAGLASVGDFLLAGGLNSDNVRRAIAQVHPWGVDVSSGVETGGVKDPVKIEAFISAARAADLRATPS